MITIRPVKNALVPVDSDAAHRISAPNYDEFQSDEEVRERIAASPESVLRVTMPHCFVPPGAGAIPEGSSEALDEAVRALQELASKSRTRRVRDVLWVYEILDPGRPGTRQIGLGGMAVTAEIRSDANPSGSLIRNEGIRESKARGRADLIEHTRAIVGTVSLAVDDDRGALFEGLTRLADERPCDFAAVGERGVRHSVWLVDEPGERHRMIGCLAAEPRAYVADGNHRSAAAVMLGLEEFPAVFFPARTMGIRPYNRLVAIPPLPPGQIIEGAGRWFRVRVHEGARGFQPDTPHRVGLYEAGRWFELDAREPSYDPEDAVQDIAADIVQRCLFADVLGIADPRDPRLTFVGGDRGVDYLERQVDTGRYGYAVTLPAVTMGQFVRVCRQNRLMPPKSTWFEPKIRSGLVMVLLDPERP